jgi:alpha-tubulin suppressor-like RCC1 family protein
MRLLAVLPILLLLAACHDEPSADVDGSVAPPRDVAPPVTPSEHRLALGELHTCYLDDGGAPYCWGSDDRNQLGDGRPATSKSVPTAVTVVDRAVEIAAGGGSIDGHTLVRVENGDIRGWGANDAGQLGDGTRMAPETFTTAVNMFEGNQLVTSFHDSCARSAGNTMACWGTNDQGQLALPLEVLGALSPIGASSALIDQIAIGEDHACLILSVPVAGATVMCWGRNVEGQTGATGTGEQRAFVAVQGLTATTSAIGLGYTHGCAIDETAGGVRCWGNNTSGQLGDGNTAPRANVAVVVAGLAGPATAVCGGEAHTCARLATGAVQCWGANDQGQLGDGSNTERHAPVTVTGLEGVAELACGGKHTCARLAAGGVRCWGANAEGQLGDGSVAARSVPVAAQGL